MPDVFRYLANELAAMGIKMKMDCGEGPYSSARVHAHAQP
jgi:hypothetical protein